MEHCPRRYFVRHKRPARISHHAKLGSKAELVMFAPPDCDLQPIGRRQSIVTDQTVFIGRHAEQLLSILNFEKLPPGHLFTPCNIAPMASGMSENDRFRTG